MFDYSIEPWRDLFFNCPSVHVNIYSDGIKIMEHYLTKSKVESERQAYVDTIMMIYDQRMVYFGNHHRYPEGWIWGRKGIDILKYRGADPKRLHEAFDCFNRAYQLQGNMVEPGVMFAWIQTGRNLFNSGEIQDDEFLGLYFRIKGYAVNQLSMESDSSKIIVYKQLSDFSVRMVLESVRNRCDIIEGYLTKTHDLSLSTPEQVQQTLTLLEGLSCTNTDYYISVLEKTYERNRSSELAFKLARSYVKRNDFTKAREYYQKSMQNNDDITSIATANYEWAVLEMTHFKNPAKALSLARTAVQLNPGWGRPYLLIGNIYAQAAPDYGDNEFEKQTVYLAAVDKFQAALKADSTISDEAIKFVETYSKYFPDRETAFFHGYHEGEQIEIGSWINESTKVRFRNRN